MVEIGRDRPGPLGEGQRRVALQRRMAASLVVVSPELGKLPFQDTGIPEQHMVENFSPHLPDHRSMQTVVAVYLAAHPPVYARDEATENCGGAA